MSGGGFDERIWAEIDLSAIRRNLEEVLKAVNRSDSGAEGEGESPSARRRNGDEHKAAERRSAGGGDVIAVVKANAYGHGLAEVAAELWRCGVRRFAVACLDEGERLSDCLAELGAREREREILILGYTPPGMAAAARDAGCTQAIVSAEYAAELADCLPEDGGRLRCHLAIDTGMARIGIRAEERDEAIKAISDHRDKLDVTAIFTHLCAADSDGEEDLDFTLGQIGRFAELWATLVPYGICEAHCMNSAGALRFAEECRELLPIRVGLALYGLSPMASPPSRCRLYPALSLYARIATVRTVYKGESVGYGRSYVAGRDMRIATLPVGYADGYPRALSGCGYVLINGMRAPVVGRICMNQMMADVTEIEGAAAGGIVTLIGESFGERITADDLATLAGTISYDILSGIPERVPKIYKNKT